MNYEHSIAIFVARESIDTALRTMNRTAAAAVEGSVIDVLVNGDFGLASSIRDRIHEVEVLNGTVIRLWSIRFGDKAHAWNQYFHHIWAGEQIAWFIDGYVMPEKNAFVSIREVLKTNEKAWGATGVPSVGHSATKLRRTMLKNGGFHGNLCCLRGQVVERLVEQNIYLPLGLYWVDGLVGALLNFGLDPDKYAWDPSRVLVDPEATWTRNTRSYFGPAGAAAQFKRALRQARGEIENSAIKRFLFDKKTAPAMLPKTANELVLNWAGECPREVASLLRYHPLRRYAFKQLKTPRDWALSNYAPELLCEWVGS